HGERGRGQAREAADRRAPVRAPLALAGRAAARAGAERVPEDTRLGGVRRLASRPHRRRGRGGEGALRVRLRRLPPSAPDGPDRLRLPCRGVAAQGDRACSTRAPAVPRPKERLTTRRGRAPRNLLGKPWPWRSWRDTPSFSATPAASCRKNRRGVLALLGGRA